MNSRLLRLPGILILLAASLPGRPASDSAAQVERPRLIVLITIDQFRNDYLDRFRPYFGEGGFNLLLGGARFVNCFHGHAVTATGPGHASLVTGAHPRTHGIIGNEWYDRAQKRIVNCVEDPVERRVSGTDGPDKAPGGSPRMLRGSTFGDELRRATNSESKVIAVSLKDRGAILPGGRTASAAYWFDAGGGRFVTSTYYMKALPEWADRFNNSNPGRKYCGKAWQALPQTPEVGGKTFALYRAEDDPFCSSAGFMQWLRSTPFITEIELEFALEAVRHERLGLRGGTDLLTISLSANDYIGHAFGPDSPQVADMILQTDKALAGFFSEINSLVGLEHVWIALSADHGVAPTPRWIKEHRLGRGNAPIPSTRDIAQEALARAFGKEKWLEAAASRYLYLNHAASARKKVDLGKAEEAAAQALRQSPGVAAAFTRTQLAEGTLPQTALSAQAIRNFDAKRAGDLLVLLEPYALPGLPDDQATHGSPWSYDAQVPLILWGRAFKRGTYEAPCLTVDLVPTLFAALGLASPSGVEGRPLGDALQGSSGRLGTPTSENDSPDSPRLWGNP